MGYIEGSRKRTHKVSAPPTNGTSGTLVGEADKGDLLVDTSTGDLYVNTGTSANVTWALVGDQTAS